MDAIERGKQTIGIARGIKLFGISRSTFQTWAMEKYFHCGQSLSTMCNNAHPQQLTVNEVHKMHRMLTSEDYLHWPIISVAYAEHTRHRSIAGFLLNRISAIAAYSFFPKKTSIKKDIEKTNPALIAQHNQPKLIAA